MRPTRSFSSDLLADRCRCSLRRPLDLELVLEAREDANIGVIELGKAVQANRFSLRPPISWGAANMVPISSDLKPLKTLIVSVIASPLSRLVARLNIDINIVSYAIADGYSESSAGWSKW